MGTKATCTVMFSQQMKEIFYLVPTTTMAVEARQKADEGTFWMIRVKKVIHGWE